MKLYVVPYRRADGQTTQDLSTEDWPSDAEADFLVGMKFCRKESTLTLSYRCMKQIIQ
jgi:hypothetical protein